MTFVSLITLLLLLSLGKSMDSAPARVTDTDYDVEWDELFGHLDRTSGTIGELESFPGLKISDKQSKPETTKNVSDRTPEKDGSSNLPMNSKRPLVPPALPAQPFVFDPTSIDKNPGVVAHSQGNISVSQNGGIALGIYMGHSSYNSISYIFGGGNKAHSRPQDSPKNDG